MFPSYFPIRLPPTEPVREKKREGKYGPTSICSTGKICSPQFESDLKAILIELLARYWKIIASIIPRKHIRPFPAIRLLLLLVKIYDAKLFMQILILIQFQPPLEWHYFRFM